jgi:hypothetical protein
MAIHDSITARSQINSTQPARRLNSSFSASRSICQLSAIDNVGGARNDLPRFVLFCLFLMMKEDFGQKSPVLASTWKIRRKNTAHSFS